MVIRRLPLDLRAKEGRKEKVLPLIFLFPIVPRASSPVTRVSLAFRARLCVKNEEPGEEADYEYRRMRSILGDPEADSRGEGKSKRAEKYGTKKSKERREEPMGTMSYQTSSKRSPPF